MNVQNPLGNRTKSLYLWPWQYWNTTNHFLEKEERMKWSACVPVCHCPPAFTHPAWVLTSLGDIHLRDDRQESLPRFTFHTQNHFHCRTKLEKCVFTGFGGLGSTRGGGRYQLYIFSVVGSFLLFQDYKPLASCQCLQCIFFLFLCQSLIFSLSQTQAEKEHFEQIIIA